MRRQMLSIAGSAPGPDADAARSIPHTPCFTMQLVARRKARCVRPGPASRQLIGRAAYHAYNEEQGSATAAYHAYNEEQGSATQNRSMHERAGPARGSIQQE